MRVLEKPFLGGCSSSESVWISKKEKQQVRDPSEWVQLLHTRKNGTYEGLYARSEGCHGRKCDTYGQRGRMDREAARTEDRLARKSGTSGGQDTHGGEGKMPVLHLSTACTTLPARSPHPMPARPSRTSCTPAPAGHYE